MFNENGSLVEARQNPHIYSLMLIILLIFLVLVVIGFILKRIRELHASPQWIEEHKNVTTTKKNIENVSLLAKLDDEEKKLLKQICQKFKPRNIEYLIRDEEAIKALCRQQYDEMKAKNASGEDLDKFFKMLFKLERAHDAVTLVTSTRSLKQGQKFTFIDEKSNKWTLTLERNDQSGLILAIPTSFAKSESKPQRLSKFVLTFKTEAGTIYTLLTRVVRYEEEKSGKYILIASSNNTLSYVQRRGSKRKHLENTCMFSAAKIINQGKSQDFEILEKKYEGKMQNISADGCRLCCSLPIKEGQYLSINFTTDTSSEAELKYNAIGYIVGTIKSPDNKQYILHVKYVDIDIDTKNKISAFIYEYDT